MLQFLLFLENINVSNYLKILKNDFYHNYVVRPISSEPNRESKGQLQNNLLIITSKLYRLYFSI